ncbi:HK97 family phage prohead protease [Clostridium perfringens]
MNRINIINNIEVRSINNKLEIKGLISINFLSEIIFCKEKNIVFRERIMPGAFDGILKKGQIPKLLLNHDYKLELKAEFKTIKETSKGLEFVAIVDNDFYLSEKLKDISGLSFGFSVGIDKFHKVNNEYIRDIFSFKKFIEISILLGKEPCYSKSEVSISPTQSKYILSLRDEQIKKMKDIINKLKE